jgi:glycosyltransferase involved in cell wall biosynthesis
VLGQICRFPFPTESAPETCSSIVTSATQTSGGGDLRICVTPTRNEAWIIERFLAAAKTWASHVIVADQGSTDGTLQQLQSASDVEVVINDSPVYDEAYRQKILLSRARQFEGKKVFIALDADEALSANCLQSKEWKRVGEAKPGTVLRFRWVNILPGFEEAWIPGKYSAFGFVDDGCDFTGRRIHSTRVPQPAGAPVIDLHDVVVLHFQYVAWERMASKHRWYQAWEHVKHQQKGPLQIFREYHHMYGSWEKNEIHPVKPEWLDGYERAGIGFRSLESESVTYWDKEVLEMLREHGAERFRKIGIWDKDWKELADQMGFNGSNFSDPRSAWEKTAHWLLRLTQKRRTNPGVRGFEKLLRLSGW